MVLDLTDIINCFYLFLCIARDWQQFGLCGQKRFKVICHESHNYGDQIQTFHFLMQLLLAMATNKICSLNFESTYFAHRTVFLSSGVKNF